MTFSKLIKSQAPVAFLLSLVILSGCYRVSPCPDPQHLDGQLECDENEQFDQTKTPYHKCACYNTLLPATYDGGRTSSVDIGPDFPNDSDPTPPDITDPTPPDNGLIGLPDYLRQPATPGTGDDD